MNGLEMLLPTPTIISTAYRAVCIMYVPTTLLEYEKTQYIVPWSAPGDNVGSNSGGVEIFR